MAISPENGVVQSVQKVINRAADEGHVVFKLPIKSGAGTAQFVAGNRAKSAAELAGRIATKKG